MSGHFLPGMSEMEGRLEKGLLNIVQFIEAQAKTAFQDVGGPLPRPPSAPGEPPVVQTGNLRRSINSTVVREGEQIVGYVGTNAGYGLFVEAGTSRMAARPFLVPSAMEGLARAVELLGAGMR